MNDQSENENSSVQVDSQNNYKYDKYGFVLVNSIEDLLYDKFNNYMGKDIKNIKNKKNQIDNGNSVNLNMNYQSNPSKRGKKKKDNMDKSMKIILNINNKEKKILKINPNDSRSIDTSTMKDKDSKDSDTKNTNTNKNNKYNSNNNRNKNKKKEPHKKQKYLSHKRDNEDKKQYDEDYENCEQFTFRDKENEKTVNNLINKKKMKKMFKKKKSIDSKDLENISENEDEIDKYDINKNIRNSKPKNMKKSSIKNQNNFYYYSLPVLSPCVMSKARKTNPDIIQAVPKSNREFITKTYENGNKKEKAIKILTWPNSSICYFNRSNKIINVNIHIPMQNVINKNFFCTKEIIDSHNIKNISHKRLSKNPFQNEDSSNIIIQIVNPENSPFKYGKINIRTGSGKKSNSKNKSYIFRIHGNKNKKRGIKKLLFKDNNALSRSKCLKNQEIRSALNIKKSKSKSKSKKKEKLNQECITLRRRKRFGDQIYKKIMKKKALFNPLEYKISIKTKFRNDIMNNIRMPKEKKEEEKLVKNNSMNRFDLNNKNNKIIYPYIKKTINDENHKNKSISIINDQRGYSDYNTLGKYSSRYNYNNDSEIFPAINSYFH